VLSLFIGNETRRAFRSYRIHALAAAFMFQAIVDPLGAKLLPKLGQYFGISAEDVPSPAPLQALQAYGSDSTRLVLMVFTIVAMTAAADEFRRGSDSGAFVFTKGADPRALLNAKVLVWALAATLTSLAGLIVAVLVTTSVVGVLPARPVAYTVVGTLLFWPLASTVVVTSATASRSSWGGMVAGVGLIATGVLELAGIFGSWMPTALLTVAEKVPDSGGDLQLLLRPLVGMLSLALPAYLWAWAKASAPGWD
jgi:hypothetical protein